MFGPAASKIDALHLNYKCCSFVVVSRVPAICNFVVSFVCSCNLFSPSDPLHSVPDDLALFLVCRVCTTRF